MFMPTKEGVVTRKTAAAVGRVNELGLSSIVQIIQLSSDENLECLEHLAGEKCGPMETVSD